MLTYNTLHTHTPHTQTHTQNSHLKLLYSNIYCTVTNNIFFLQSLKGKPDCFNPYRLGYIVATTQKLSGLFEQSLFLTFSPCLLRFGKDDLCVVLTVRPRLKSAETTSILQPWHSHAGSHGFFQEVTHLASVHCTCQGKACGHT